MEQEINVLHAIIPNPIQKKGKLGWRGMPFLSIRYEYGREADKCLDVAGFHEFPAIAPRWDVVATDVYGHGPAEEALPDVKMLQVLRRREAEVADKMSKPPLIGDASLKNSLLTMIPGGVNFSGAPGQAGNLRPIFEINPAAIQQIRESVTQTQQQIEGAFFGDLIAQFSQGETPDMTAREVDERHEEKVLLLGPMLERFHGEALSPAIDIVFNRMARVGILPPPPQALRGQHVEPEYISLLAQAQRAIGTTSIEQLFGFAGRLMAVDPSAMDNLNTDKAIADYAEMIGTTPEVVRSPDDIAQIRAGRKQQEMAAQTAQNGMAAVQGAQTLSQIPVGQGANNALSAMTGLGQ
jgi:hypothetical protein